MHIFGEAKILLPIIPFQLWSATAPMKVCDVCGTCVLEQIPAPPVVS